MKRRLLRLLLVALLALGGLAAGAFVSAVGLRPDLEAGRRDLLRAQSALERRDLAGATLAFARARLAFERAADSPHATVLRVAGRVPALGRIPGAIVSMTEIARDLSGAGGRLTARLAELPGGLAALAPTGGRLPVEALSGLHPVVHAERLGVERAAARAAALPDRGLPGPLAPMRDLAAARTRQAVAVLAAADGLLEALPALAGTKRPVRYFLASQNLSEARGTGGLIGNYSIVTIDRGRIALSPFRDIRDLPNLPASAAPGPSGEFRALYSGFGGAGFWRNLNMTPDAPLAATLIEDLYERVEGVELDGTILVDLRALSAMVEASGRVPVPELGVVLTGRNVMRFLGEAEYAEHPSGGDEGPLLAAQAILHRFLEGERAEAKLHALVTAALGGHLVLHSRDPGVQEAFRRAGVDGGFGWRGGQFFGLAANNMAGNKVDYFMERRLRYEIDLRQGGEATVRTSAWFANGVPRGTGPGYAFGPYPGTGLGPGENLTWTSFYSSSGCRMAAAAEDGGPIHLQGHRDLGMSLATATIRTRPQETRRIDLSLACAGAWSGHPDDGRYLVRLQAPPSVRPVRASVSVRVPEGTAVTWVSEPVSVSFDTVTWRGALERPLVLELTFSRPALAGAWGRVRELLARPVFTLG